MLIYNQDYTLENKKLVVKDHVKTIDPSFNYSDFEQVILPPYLNIIKALSFYQGKLTSLIIPNSVLEIGFKAFAHNYNLKHIILPSNLNKLAEGVFLNCDLRKITLPKNLTTIETNAFRYNKLTNINIPPNVKKIGSGAFADNQLSNVFLPDSITEIGNYAFSNNCLQQITLPKNLTKIPTGMCLNNFINQIVIPSSVTEIGENAFDNIDVIYKDKKITKEEIRKYGCENIIRISKILSFVPDFKFNDISKPLLMSLPLTKQAIKSFKINLELFKKIKQEIFNKQLTDDNLYKLCYILGIFNLDKAKQKQIINILFDISQYYHHSKLQEVLTPIKLTNYYPTLAYTLLTEYENPELFEVLAEYYNRFLEIDKNIKLKKKENLALLNSKIKKGQASKELEKLMIADLKKIHTTEICHYLKEHLYKIRPGNEKLLEIVEQLKPYIKDKHFEEIQDIYEQSKIYFQTNEHLLESFKGKWNKYNYYFVQNSDPVNFILGYLVNCCAKYGSKGHDIMVQSMINPQIKNLIIYDNLGRIIGKSTAFYNLNEQYILFNNAEISQKFIDTKSIEEKIAVLHTIIEASICQVEKLSQKSLKVSEVRMGMDRNDLKKAILKEGLPILYDELLANYPYKEYIDSVKDKSQAIILKKDKKRF